MRAPISNHTLAMLVIEELEHNVGEDVEFTAYDVTRAIRRRQPQFDLPHGAVRVLVHQYMNSLVAAGHYQAGMRAFGMKRAISYAPTSVAAARPVITDVPLLDLN